MPETAEWMQIDAAVAAEEARAQAQTPVEPTRVRVRVRVEADAASAAEHTEALQALWALDEAAAQDDAEKQGAVEEAAAEAEFTARYGVDQQVELAEDARHEHAAARMRWMRQVWAAVAIDTALVETVLRLADALAMCGGICGSEPVASLLSRRGRRVPGLFTSLAGASGRITAALGAHIAVAAASTGSIVTANEVVGAIRAGESMGEDGRDAVARSVWHARVLAVLVARRAAAAAAARASAAELSEQARSHSADVDADLAAYSAACATDDGPTSEGPMPEEAIHDWEARRTQLIGGDTQEARGPTCAHWGCNEPALVLVSLLLPFQLYHGASGSPIVGRWGQEAAAWAQHQEPAAICCGWVADSQCTGCGAPAEDPTQRNFYFGPVPGWRSIAAYCAAAHTPPAFALLCVGCARAAASATAYDGGGSGYPGHDGAPLCARSSLFMANHGELTCSCCDPRGQRRAAAVEAVHARALAAHAARQARRAARRSSFVLEAGEALAHAARAAATAAGQTVREARRAEAAATAAAGALAAAVQAAELPPEAGAHRLSPRRM